MGKLAKRLIAPLVSAAVFGAAFGTAIAWWLQEPLGRAFISVVAGIFVALSIVFVSLRSLTEPLQRLTASLQANEKPSNLLLKELGELGQALSSAWQRWEEAFEQLKGEQTLMSAILGRMAEAVIATDEDGKVLLINPAAESMLRLPKDWAGKRLTELPLPFELLDLVQRALRQGTPQWDELHFLFPEERFLEVYASPLFVDGRRAGALLVARDLTGLKRLERIRKDFVANVSHELRTPIATLRSLAEALLMGGKDDPKVRDDFLQTIVSETERMSRLLDNLLELARIEAGQREWLMQTVKVCEVVNQVTERLKFAASRKGLTLVSDVPEDLVLETDPDALAQALFNLVDNAIKYTHEGEVSIRCEKVTTADRDWVVISVSDTGIGIPPEHLPRIFERFYRVDKARSRQLGGFGLGLSIAKHIVENLGGKIVVKSEVGKGSTFSVWLPSA